MENLPNVAGSRQRLTNTSNNLAAAEDRKTVASKWAKVLLGCYRTGDANDPEIYVGSIIALLCGYPADVIESVCSPLTGLPARSKWLPALAEVRAACEEIAGPRKRMSEWDRAAAEQLAEREAAEQTRATRPTLVEMKAKYGPNWGMNAAPKPKWPSFTPYTDEQLRVLYPPKVSRETSDSDAPQ